MVSINELPEEILEIILFKLPPYKDLDSCAFVCKRWAQIVHNVKRLTSNNLHKGLADYRLCWNSLVQLDVVPTIAGRFSHSAIVHENSMYIYGGGSSTDTTFNDLWRFDLSKREWIRPLSMGTYPAPKACATIVCYKNALIVFGGWRHPSAYPLYQPLRLFNELHVYSITANKWAMHTQTDAPPPLAGHSATIHRNQMIVFGGYQETLTMGSSNDVWSLDLDHFVWKCMATSTVKPPPRYGQFQVYLDEDHLLILGGCGGPNNIFSDAWVLKMKGAIWTWHSVSITNKKWSASHMYCNAACKVGSKLVVLGPTASEASDFQMVKQNRACVIANPELARQNRQPAINNIPDVAAPRFRAAIDQPALRNPNQIVEEANRRLLEERNRPINRDNMAGGGSTSRPQSSTNSPGPSSGYLIRRPFPRNNDDEEEAASRLKRNLQLKSRDEDDLYLPKRFDQPIPDRLGMVAFSVQENPVNNESPAQHERRLEGLRRMEEKIRTMRRAQDVEDLPSPKRVKRNSIGLFVCDISQTLSDTPTLDWIEYKNNGIVDGAPERLILSSIVAGKGELIMFGGIRKESLANSTVTTQVSNGLHFLSFPRGVL